MSTSIRTVAQQLAFGLALFLVMPGIAVAQATPAVSAAQSAAEIKALSRLSKAQDKLAEANRDIAAANNRQSTATAAGKIAGDDFRAITASVPSFATSADAKAWAKIVSDASARWTKADQSGAKGGKQLAGATKRQKKAEQDIARAQAEVDASRAARSGLVR